MQKLLYILTITILFASCADDPTKVKIKKKAMEREKFVKILADIHMMDAITNQSGYFRKYEPEDSIDLYSSIFDKYGVSKAEFDSTVSVYSKKPDLYLNLYDDVIFELNFRLDSLRDNTPKFEVEEKEEEKEQMQ